MSVKQFSVSSLSSWEDGGLHGWALLPEGQGQRWQSCHWTPGMPGPGPALSPAARGVPLALRGSPFPAPVMVPPAPIKPSVRTAYGGRGFLKESKACSLCLALFENDFLSARWLSSSTLDSQLLELSGALLRTGSFFQLKSSSLAGFQGVDQMSFSLLQRKQIRMFQLAFTIRSTLLAA